RRLGGARADAVADRPDPAHRGAAGPGAGTCRGASPDSPARTDRGQLVRDLVGRHVGAPGCPSSRPVGPSTRRSASDPLTSGEAPGCHTLAENGSVLVTVRQ